MTDNDRGFIAVGTCPSCSAKRVINEGIKQSLFTEFCRRFNSGEHYYKCKACGEWGAMVGWKIEGVDTRD